MNLFDISNKGVALGKTNEGTSADRHLEIAYPANFHINTTLPDTINYNPPWWSAQPFFINGITSTSIPLAFKKVGTHVYLQGSVNGLRYDGAADNFMLLPPQLRPMTDHYFIMPSTTAGRIGMGRIATTGIVQLQYTMVSQDEGNSSSNNIGSWRYDIDTDYFTASNEPLTEDVMQMPEWTYLYNLGPINGLRLRGNAGVSQVTTSQMQSYTWDTGSTRMGVYNNGKTSSSGTGYAGYGYIAVDGQICIPVGKTQMKVNLCHYNNATTSVTLAAALALIDVEETTVTRGSGSTNATLSFSGNYVNSVCSSNITFTSNAYMGNNTNYGTFTLDLPENFNYTRPVYVVISYRTSSDWRRDLMTNKIWFE